MTDSRRAAASADVTVTAPARLHMGFLDPGGALGREFGSIGVALNEVVTRVCFLRVDGQEGAGGGRQEKSAVIARRLSKIFGFPDTAEVTVQESIPEHIGLGSGTQLALAIGMGLQRLYGSDRSVREVARAIGRGKRSGIGIAVFERGGFVVDGGRGPKTVTPPPLARFEVPPRWRFILVFDSRGQGLHGDSELAAFRALPPFPGAEAARLCHLLLLRGLPAIAEEDLAEFGAVITEIQRSVGDYFAPAQGGRFTSPDVARCLAWLEQQGAVGIGQTSWGPTGFCLVDGPAAAQRLVDHARVRFAECSNLSLLVASARNTGAAIESGDPPERSPVPPTRSLDPRTRRTP